MAELFFRSLLQSRPADRNDTTSPPFLSPILRIPKGRLAARKTPQRCKTQQNSLWKLFVTLPLIPQQEKVRPISLLGCFRPSAENEAAQSYRPFVGQAAKLCFSITPMFAMSLTAQIANSRCSSSWLHRSNGINNDDGAGIPSPCPICGSYPMHAPLPHLLAHEDSLLKLC
jgi:hypothetical protein